METPCIRVCKLKDSVCIGCGRTQEQLRMWTTYTDEQRTEIMKNLKPELYDKYAEKERKPKKEEPMAKPHGIERKGSKFKVFLEHEGKRIHIGYYKTLDAAEDALEQAKQDAGIE